MVWYNGDSYTGDWREKKKHGVGIYNYQGGDRYEGQWYNDLKSGYGTYYYANGKYYRGQFANDELNGEGEFHWPDGSYTVGIFKNDAPYRGTHYFARNSKWAGESVTGYYVGWHLHGQCLYTNARGESYYCLYDKGKFIKRL